MILKIFFSIIFSYIFYIHRFLFYEIYMKLSIPKIEFKKSNQKFIFKINNKYEDL